jgi:glycerol uptake facilitator-like aquaporin
VYLAIAIWWGTSHTHVNIFTFSPPGLSPGAVLACTFTALTLSSPTEFQATSICMYYLCQQVGGIVGTGVSFIALHAMFNATLERWLGVIPHKKEVCDLKFHFSFTANNHRLFGAFLTIPALKVFQRHFEVSFTQVIVIVSEVFHVNSTCSNCRTSSLTNSSSSSMYYDCTGSTIDSFSF